MKVKSREAFDLSINHSAIYSLAELMIKSGIVKKEDAANMFIHLSELCLDHPVDESLHEYQSLRARQFEDLASKTLEGKILPR